MLAKAIIRNFNDNESVTNNGLLVMGDFDPSSKKLNVRWHGRVISLSHGCDCQILELESMVFSIAERPSCYAALNGALFDDLGEAVEYQKTNGGFLFYGSSWMPFDSDGRVLPQVRQFYPLY